MCEGWRVVLRRGQYGLCKVSLGTKLTISGSSTLRQPSDDSTACQLDKPITHACEVMSH